MIRFIVRFRVRVELAPTPYLIPTLKIAMKLTLSPTSNPNQRHMCVPHSELQANYVVVF